MGPDSQSKDPHPHPVINKRRKWTSQENKIVMECYLLSEPKIRAYRKRMLSLRLQKDMFWVSEQRSGKYYSQEQLDDRVRRAGKEGNWE